MSQSPAHRQMFISDLEWLVMPPVLLGQFRLYYQEAPGQTPGTSPAATGAEPQSRPAGVLLWASVSAEVAARLAQGTPRLKPGDWKSGEEVWVVEAIAPFGGAEAMVADLKANVFAGKEVRYLATGRMGKEG